MSRRIEVPSFFNLGFGVIDLYQALASFMHFPPEEYFRWTRVDDLLHIVIGLILTVAGLHGMFEGKQQMSNML
jgi:heme/copper-type cytochrome/quinol oxidase subunit 4